MKQRTLFRFPSLSIVLVALTAACGGGGTSCSCLAPIKGGFPVDARHEGAMQMRLSQGGVNYLQQNGKTLVSTLLPMGQTFNVPPSCGGSNEVCCGNPQPMCRMDLNIQTTSLVPTPPSVLKFAVTMKLKTIDKLPVAIDPGFGGKMYCYVDIDTDKSTTQYKDVEIAADVTFKVDGTTKLTSITLANTQVNRLDQSMLTISSQPKDTFKLCSVGNVSFVKSFMIDQLKKQLAGQIAGALDDSLCGKCQMKDDCSALADACTGGKCMRAGKCLQEIGATGRLDLGAMFASLSPGTKAKMDVQAVLGGYADVTPQGAAGLSLGLLGGGVPAPHHPCVPARPAPAAPPVDKWSQYNGEKEPAGMAPYHLGLGIHDSHLNTMSWAAYDAGALCLNVGTPKVPQLSASAIKVIIPSLDDLMHGQNGPVYIAMRPQKEASMAIGAGTFDVDMSGKKTIKEPLLDITMPDFNLDFYVFVDDRFVRAMTLTADVKLGVSLDIDGMGQLVPVMGDLGKAFTNLRVTNSSLLAEKPSSIAALFPTLLGVAVGQIGDALKPIALPAVMGLKIKPVAIGPTDNKKFVSLFANFDLMTMEAFHAETQAEVARVIAPPTEAFHAEGGLDPARQPAVELELGGFGIDGSAQDLEWSWSVDGGAWSPYATVSRVAVSDPMLWLQGRHFVDVRARMRGEPATTDLSPVRLSFIVDTIAPAGRFDLAGGEARAAASDAVTEAAMLEYSFRAGGAWSPWTRGGSVALVDVFGAGATGERAGSAEEAAALRELAASLLEVRVRDEAGNVAVLGFHGRTTAPSSGGCGCRVGDGPGGEDAEDVAVILVFAAFALFIARRRIAARAHVIVVALMVLGACNEDVQRSLDPSELLDPNDEIGRHSDAVARGGVIHVSAYDSTTGDLAYAQVAVADVAKPISWQWVDGVPADEPAGAPGSFRRGTSVPGEDVGRYTSIALTTGGDPRIAYFDVTAGRLKLASATARERGWKTSVVDQVAPGSAGWFASLSVGPGDVPSIAYVVTAQPNPDGKGGFVGRLRLATAKNAAPAGPADWNIKDLDDTPIPCAGIGKPLCATGQACISTDPADPSKSVCKPVANNCSMMCPGGEACVGGACAPVLVPVTAPDLVPGVGLFAQLERLPNGNRSVLYYDREQGDLLLALETGPGTFTGALVDGNDPTTDVGQSAAAMAGPDNTLHVAYVDAMADRLLYRTVSGTLPGPLEVVDDGARGDGPHVVGGGASLWTDGNAVRIAYQDQTTAQLMVATRAGGAWTKQALRAGTAGFGFYPRWVSDGGKLFVTHFVYDRAQMAPASIGRFEITPVP